MIQDAAGILACPHCGAELQFGDQVGCENRHRFDIARQGYLNLLGRAQPANADTAAMLTARDRVLTTGLFDPVTQAVARQVIGARILEVGSGTAHHLAGVLDGSPQALGIAMDISTAAGRFAARRAERIAAVVADVWHGIPVLPGSIDTLLCLFAPRNPAEFARVLSPDGRLLVAVPGAGHLAELREHYGLLGIEPAKTDRLLNSLAAQFTPVECQQVNRTTAMSASLIADVIAMGPNAHHRLPPTPVAAEVSIDVAVWVFRPLH